jgi:hypothetical protein
MEGALKLTLSVLLLCFLCSISTGRGGGINSHAGNKTFRDWVRERKEAYNLAPSKADKAVVANEVVALVKALDPPGRFLQRDPNSSSNASSWIEVDETRALAKTSQALREGAPEIRAAHKDELETRARKPKRKKTAQAASASPALTPARPSKLQILNTNTASTIYMPPSSMSTSKPVGPAQASGSEAGMQRDRLVPSGSSIVAPLMSNSQFDEAYGRSAKRGRIVEPESEPFFSASAETPPLTSVPAPRISIPPLRASFEAAVKLADGGNSNYNRLKRSHSLALSEISAGDISGGDEDFVNPFADESELLLGNVVSKPNTPRGLRNVSSIASGEHEEGGFSSNGLRSRGSIGSWSTK